MTSQMLMTDTSANLSQIPERADSTPGDDSVDNRQSRSLDAMKSQYPFDQQVEFLNLQAETESLLQQLRALKQQREISPESTPVATV
jgi:polyhydroxyalkanoate synthesis regulator phasin